VVAELGQSAKVARFEMGAADPLTVGNALPTVDGMRKPKQESAIALTYLMSVRRSLCERLEAAEKGHPKPDLVKQLAAEIDEFDAKHPHVRGAR
jgi:hypothetical protein